VHIIGSKPEKWGFDSGVLLCFTQADQPTINAYIASFNH